MENKLNEKLKKRSRSTDEVFDKILVFVLDTDSNHYHETRYY